MADEQPATAAVRHGFFKKREIATTPAPLAAFLAENKLITAAVVKKIFADFAPQELNFAGFEFDERAVSDLGSELSRSTSLVAFSLAGATAAGGKPLTGLDSVLFGLIENLSVRAVDFCRCGLTATEANLIASSVVPWNKTVISWDLAENDFGHEAVAKLCAALAQAMSTVQCLSLRHTGAASLETTVFPHLLQLSSLIQVDVSENEGYDPSDSAPPALAAAFARLEDTLAANVRQLHPPDSEFVHLSLKSGKTFAEVRPPPRSTSPAAAAPAAGGAPKEPHAAAGLPRRLSMRGKEKDGALRPSGAVNSGGNAGSGGGGGGAGAGSGAAASGKTAPASAAKTAAAAGGEAAHGGGGGAATKAAPAAAPAEPGGAEAKPDAKPPRASSVPPRAPSARRSVARSPARAPAPPPPDEEMTRWNEIKAQYNQAIRCDSPNAVKHQIFRGDAKFILGKRVETLRARPSPSFCSGYARLSERTPTPSETRKLAPWNQTGAGHPTTHVGGVYRVPVPTTGGDEGRASSSARGRPPAMIRFVDGGDVTAIKDDPRDIGHFARKVQEKKIRTPPTQFNSNSPRVLNWVGTGDNVAPLYAPPKRSNTPGPGAYVVPSEWEVRAKKLRDCHRAQSPTGRPCFGGSSAPRSMHQSSNDAPGPGFYDIP